MSRYILRTDSTEPLPTGGVSLDWFDDDPRASTIALRPSRRLDARPSAGASALMRFATTVAAVDQLESRSSAGDGWTRDLELSVPGARLPALDRPRTVEMLRFLTGDAWTVERRRRSALAPIGAPTAHGDVVCLLSGGLDSLVGAIDLLAGDDRRRAVLASVEDQPVSVSRQTQIVRELSRRYPDRVDHVSLYVDSAKVEDTTRARSFLFIAFGLLCASAIGPDVPLFVPENGMIGLNAPLIGTRSGSASTRTTHPHFIAQLSELAETLGVSNPIVNPLRLLTKGEAVARCADQDVLAALATTSISCAHPTANRWIRGRGPCGYCYPCLIRRASLHVLHLDTEPYVFDVLTDRTFLGRLSSSRPASLRAVLAAIRRGSRPTDALANGPVPPGEAAAFADVHARGLAELERWLRTATAPNLLAWLP